MYEEYIKMYKEKRDIKGYVREGKRRYGPVLAECHVINLNKSTFDKRVVDF